MWPPHGQSMVVRQGYRCVDRKQVTCTLLQLGSLKRHTLLDSLPCINRSACVQTTAQTAAASQAVLLAVSHLMLKCQQYAHRSITLTRSLCSTAVDCRSALQRCLIINNSSSTDGWVATCQACSVLTDQQKHPCPSANWLYTNCCKANN